MSDENAQHESESVFASLFADRCVNWIESIIGFLELVCEIDVTWVRLIVWDSLTFVCTTCVTCSHVLATLECLWFWGLPSHISCWPDGVGGCQKLPTVCHFASGTHLPFFSIPKWPQNEPNFRLVILQTICSSGKKIWATFFSQKMTKIVSEVWAY